jgi:hypothetical protein
MSWPDLLNGLAASVPAHPLIDVSGWSDKDLVNAITDDHYGESAVGELVKRANARHLTMADYVFDVVSKDPDVIRRSKT